MTWSSTFALLGKAENVLVLVLNGEDSEHIQLKSLKKLNKKIIYHICQ